MPAPFGPLIMTSSYRRMSWHLRRQIRNHGIEYRETGLRHAQPTLGRQLNRTFLAQDGDAPFVEPPPGELLVAGGVDAFRQTQTHHQELVGDLHMRERLVGDDPVAERL